MFGGKTKTYTAKALCQKKQFENFVLEKAHTISAVGIK